MNEWMNEYNFVFINVHIVFVFKIKSYILKLLKVSVYFTGILWKLSYQEF